MLKEHIKSAEIYSTGYARDCELVTNYGKCGPNTWIIRPCGREANYERALVHLDGFTVLTAICAHHASEESAKIAEWERA